MEIVAYYQLGKRGKSQQAIVKEFAKKKRAKIIAEFMQPEKARRVRKVKHEKLIEAIDFAADAKATLVIPRFGRLMYSPVVLDKLTQSKVKFVACDNEHIDAKSVPMLASITQQQSLEASHQIKDSLAAAKRKGVQLGSARPGHWDGIEHKRGWKKGAKKSAELRSKRAEAAYSFLLPQMNALRDEGKTYAEIAEQLNEDGRVTTVGKPFNEVTVWRILHRQK